jgi:transketolase
MDTEKLATTMRRNELLMVHRAKASHISSALSITDIVAVLYGNVLQKMFPNDPGRDRFILSKGHACVAVYSALAEIDFILHKQLETFGKDNSILMNHISHNVPGVEFSTGSLGHGLSFGVGKALAAKKRLQSWRTFVLMSDGELNEGSNWEALMFAAHHGLDNITAIIDYNKLQSLGSVEKTLRLEPLAEKFGAFGWVAKEVDGHDHFALKESLSKVPWTVGKPSVLIAHTIKGKGVSFMENRVEWHYRYPNDAELEQALLELDFGCQ